ncbi:retinoic acid receptor RXR-beta-like [Ahaetulla prasina]|uniref:retinoic acid receptor RXR-beta-like n=1 Tax=Ahaetulla prasina TaxID=499056 RepID=UPI0026475B2B|nr:retinoic acid receptor RXR-beta-like [Ahaetulla prasina]
MKPIQAAAAAGGGARHPQEQPRAGGGRERERRWSRGGDKRGGGRSLLAAAAARQSPPSLDAPLPATRRSPRGSGPRRAEATAAQSAGGASKPSFPPSLPRLCAPGFSSSSSSASLKPAPPWPGSGSAGGERTRGLQEPRRRLPTPPPLPEKKRGTQPEKMEISLGQWLLILFLVAIPLLYEWSATFKYFCKMAFYNSYILFLAVIAIPICAVRGRSVENMK